MGDRLGIFGTVGTIKKNFDPGGRVPAGPQGGVRYNGQVAQGRSVQPHDCQPEAGLTQAAQQFYLRGT